MNSMLNEVLNKTLSEKEKELLRLLLETPPIGGPNGLKIDECI